MESWVNITCEEGDEPMEIHSENDGTLLLSSIVAQFPETTGLKYRSLESGKMRGVKIVDNVLYPPSQEAGWGDTVYICVRPDMPKKDERKRKTNSDTEMTSKNLKFEGSDGQTPTDLIILGIPWKCTEDDLRQYFSSLGEVEFAEVKMKSPGVSKGFGFIRFVDKEVERKVVLQKHLIGGRWCEVKVPDSKEGKIKDNKASCKIFVGRLTEQITKEDLKEHFDNFGTVIDVYIPQPFRRFAFVAFTDAQVAQSLMGKEHLIKGTNVLIGEAQAKENKDFKRDMGPGFHFQSHGHGGDGTYNKFVEMAARWALEGYGMDDFGRGGSGYPPGRFGNPMMGSLGGHSSLIGHGRDRGYSGYGGSGGLDNRRGNYSSRSFRH